jgi:hypothetical protein
MTVFTPGNRPYSYADNNPINEIDFYGLGWLGNLIRSVSNFLFGGHWIRDPNGSNKVQLIQHVNQINFLLIALKREKERPRIGFKLTENLIEKKRIWKNGLF